MHHAFRIDDAEHNAELSRARAGYRLHLGDRVLAVDLVRGADGVALLRVEGATRPVFVATRGDDVFVHLDGAAYQLRYEHPLDRLAQQAEGAAADRVRAPMPGSLIAVHVKPGQTVVRGEVLLVMESMKMETTLHAMHDGVVQDVHVAPGQTFDRDAVLVTFAAGTAP